MLISPVSDLREGFACRATMPVESCYEPQDHLTLGQYDRADKADFHGRALLSDRSFKALSQRS
jgi:hypothetical protein